MTVKSIIEKRKLENKIGKVDFNFHQVGYNTKESLITMGNHYRKELRYAYQFTVSGHGVCRKEVNRMILETRTVWIKPYIKGEDLAENT